MCTWVIATTICVGSITLSCPCFIPENLNFALFGILTPLENVKKCHQNDAGEDHVDKHQKGRDEESHLSLVQHFYLNFFLISRVNVFAWIEK